MKSVTREPARGPDLGPAARPAAARTSARLAAWDRIRNGRLHIPSAILILGAVGLVAAGQFAEDVADSPPIQMLPPTFLIRRWTVIVAVLYMLVISRVVDRTVRRSLPSLERVMRIDAVSFRGYVRRLEHPGIALNLAILAVSALIVIALFPLLGLSLVTDDPVTHQQLYLPASPGDSLLILAGYTVFGWAVLSLVYLTIRLGRALGQLTREPLEVDVFDTANLFPFGNIALAGALAPAGIIVILLLGLGQPSTWVSWTILVLAALATLMALLLPLRGIHRQMSEAKEAVLADLSARIGQVYQEVSHSPMGSPQQAGLAERTGTLIPLRKTVEEMTTWPFADTVAFGRAVLIASAPLIYTVLSELIRIFWIDPLSH